MPRIPQVFATGETGGSLAPPRAPLALAETSGIDKGLREVSEATQVYARTQRLLEDENAKIAAERALGEMQRQAADAEIALRDDPTVTPETYAKKNDENLRAIQQGVGKSMQSPQARQLFERSSGRFMVQRSIKGKWDGVELANSTAKSGTDSLLLLDSNVATFGETSAIRDEGYARGLDRIQTLRRKGIYTGTEAATRDTAFRSSVETGRVRLALMDPDQRPVILMDLLEGRRPYMSVDAQLDMADKEIKRAEAQQKKDDKDVKDLAQELKEQDMTAWTQDALKRDTNPTVMVERLDGLVRKHRLKDTEYQRLYGVLTEREKQVASDPATLRLVIADTHSMSPKMSEAILNGFKDSGKLNTKDWQAALDRRRETLESNRREGHSLVMQQHGQAEQEVLKHAGVLTPFSQLDKTQEKLIPEVLTELRRRSAAYPGGREAPLKVAEELIPRIRATIGNDAEFTVKELETQLTYFSALKLEADRRAGKISEGFYRTEKDRIQRWDAARQRQEEYQQKRGAPATGGAAKPAPSSGVNQFGRPK